MSAEDPRIRYYDAVLAFFGTWLEQQTGDRGLGYVDMFSPLHQITWTERQRDPKFTLIPGGVHPDPNGHAVMAFAFLNDTHAATTVSCIDAVWNGTKWTAESSGGQIKDATGSNEQLQFSFQADSLPWVLPEEAQLGYRLINAGPTQSKETIRVVGLAPGHYELEIDGHVVGTYSNAQFGCGIPLQANAKTPEYQQAMRVALLNKERNEKAVHPLRNEWRNLKIQRRKLERWLRAHPNDAQGAAEHEAALAQWKKPFEQRVADLIKQVRQYDARIYAINQPPVRKYTVRKVD